MIGGIFEHMTAVDNLAAVLQVACKLGREQLTSLWLVLYNGSPRFVLELHRTQQLLLDSMTCSMGSVRPFPMASPNSLNRGGPSCSIVSDSS